MVYRLREYPLFSACGLNCGLCPRYHTDGSSKCPGCAGENFLEKHPSCGVLSCCQRQEIEHCYQCDDFPCKKYEGADLTDSFVTHKNQFKDIEKAKNIGIDNYQLELNKKVAILKNLLSNYDDGRRKGFFCIAINLLELQDIECVMEQIQNQTSVSLSQKEKAIFATQLLQGIADKRGVELKLRKKSKA